MTQNKIGSGQPSIQNLQLKPEPITALTQSDINRLFKDTSLPKFDLMDIKLQDMFCKRQKAQYFLSMLERWNKRAQDGLKKSINIRTQFQLMEFIQSSLKRICLMTDNQIDIQLNMLFNWFKRQTKNNPAYVHPTMPKKNYENQQYHVSKTFRTNPTLLIKEYLRPRFILGPPNQENIEAFEEQAQLMKKKLMIKDQREVGINNFLTEFDSKNQNLNRISNGNKQNDSLKCLLLRRQDFKIRNDQLRRCIQKNEIEKHEWKFRINKGRLVSHNVKSFFEEKQNRTTKSSEGDRKNLKRQVFEQMKRMRLNTSNGKRVVTTKNIVNEIMYPALAQINNFGLLSNPFQVKLKKKKKGKGKK